MTPVAIPRRRTKQEQRDTSIAKLLDAAERLFIAKGFHATTVEELAAAAGLTKGAVFFYFNDKQAVLLALLEKVQARVLEPLTEKLGPERGTPLERVAEFMFHQSRLAKEAPAMLLLPIMVSIEFADTGDLPEKRVKWGYRRTKELLERAISDGQAIGAFRGDLSATQLASTIIAINDGAMLEWWRGDRRPTDRNLFDAILAVLSAGVLSAPADHASSEPALVRSTRRKTAGRK